MLELDMYVDVNPVTLHVEALAGSHRLKENIKRFGYATVKELASGNDIDVFFDGDKLKARYRTTTTLLSNSLSKNKSTNRVTQ